MTLSKLNYVNVGKNGTFRPSGNSEFDTAPADVDALFAHLQANGKKKIGLYFHGGLVSAKSGMNTANHITPLITGNTDVHPISFIWETGLFETIGQNLGDIYKTAFFKKLLEKLIKVAGDKLGIDVPGITGARGVGGMSYTEIRTEMNTDAPFDNIVVNVGKRSATITAGNDKALNDEILASIEYEISDGTDLEQALANLDDTTNRNLLNIDKVTDGPNKGARGLFSAIKLVKSAAAILIRVIKRHISGHDHGFYPTIIEELLRELYMDDLGVWLWGSMKDKAEEMWADDAPGTTGTDQHAGRYLLTKLKAYADANAGVTIDLIGHSAGSIVICHFLTQYLASGCAAQIRHIVFMAPACRSDLFHDTLLANKSSFQTFRMFTMQEEYEIKDRLFSPIYTRSLLYLISGILEHDENDARILGMQRYLFGQSPYQNETMLNDILAFMNQPGHAVFSVTDKHALPGFRSESTKHGNFDNQFEPTLDSIVEVIK